MFSLHPKDAEDEAPGSGGSSRAGFRGAARCRSPAPKPESRSAPADVAVVPTAKPWWTFFPVVLQSRWTIIEIDGQRISLKLPVNARLSVPHARFDSPRRPGCPDDKGTQLSRVQPRRLLARRNRRIDRFVLDEKFPPPRLRRNAAFPARRCNIHHSLFTAFGHIACLVNDAGPSAKSRGDLFDVAAESQTA